MWEVSYARHGPSLIGTASAGMSVSSEGTHCSRIQAYIQTVLSDLGQMDSQVNASLQNWNLHVDLRWVAKQIHKSVRKFTQVVNFTHIQRTCDRLVWTCVGWPNGEKLALTCRHF